MSQPITRKAQATASRQVIEADAVSAAQAPKITVDPDFKLVSAYRNTLVNWAHACPDLDGFAIVERFNADIGLSDNIVETIQEWQGWACAITDALEQHEKVTAQLSKFDECAGRGSAAHGLGRFWVAMDLDDAQEAIDKLKSGPAIGGEGVDPLDPNYVPFSGEA